MLQARGPATANGDAEASSAAEAASPEVAQQQQRQLQEAAQQLREAHAAQAALQGQVGALQRQLAEAQQQSAGQLARLLRRTSEARRSLEDAAEVRAVHSEGSAMPAASECSSSAAPAALPTEILPLLARRRCIEAAA